MASSYVNNLRLEEIGTGDAAGSWGTKTNVNLELIGEALGYGTRAIADASTDTITIADGATDSDRAMYLKLTGGGQACTVTLAPNTVSKVWMMQNDTSYTLTFKQGSGSGASVSIEAGSCKIIATDGGGSGAIVYDVLNTLEISGDLTLKTSDGAILNAQTSDTTVTSGSVLGRVDFKAPDEASGTDAILLAGSVAAIAEDTFAADNNATKLSFQVGASGAATEKMQLSSLGHLDVTGDITGASINADGDTSAGDNAAMGYTAAEGLILTGQGSTSDITLKNDADATVFTVPTGTDDILFPDNAKVMFGAGSDLQIYHDGSNSYIKDAGTGGTIFLSNSYSFRNAADDEQIILATQDGAVTLYHNGTAKLATTSVGVEIADSGNTGIAVTSTGGIGSIEVGSAASNAAFIDLKTPSSDDFDLRLSSAGGGSGGSLTVPGGTFSILGTDLHQMATFADDGAVSLYYDNAVKLATVTGGVNVTGTLTATTEVTVSSDVRFKSNIETIDSALDKVKAMRGVYFDKHGAEDKRSVGVIAQEMQEVMPEVVVTDDTEDKHLSVAYGNLVGVLIEAVKELSEEVSELRNNVQTIKFEDS
jgi:hypothetical protein